MMPALRSAHASLKGVAKVEAELASKLEGIDFYRTAKDEWEGPLFAIWGGLDDGTRARLKETWLERLLSPQHSNQVKWERTFLTTFFPRDYRILVQRALTEIPQDPAAPLPETLQAASTRFLRDLARALYSASLDRRLRSPERRAIRDSDADPLLSKLACLNRVLVERARWGDPVELRELQPELARDVHDVSPGALLRAQLARASALALAGMLKRAETSPHEALGEAFVLELRDGTRRTVSELYDPRELNSERSDWAKHPEQKLSLALAIIAHPRQGALRALWDELHQWGQFGIEAALLTPAVTSKPPSGEAGRRFERAIQGAVEAIEGGAGRAEVAGQLARLGGPTTLPEGRRARAILQLFAAVEAHPGSPGAVEVIQELTRLGRGLSSTAEFYAGSLATRALVGVGRAQAIDPLVLDRLGFEVLSMTSNPRALAMRQASLTESGLLDAPQLEDLLGRVRTAEREHIARAPTERRPDVARFLSALSKQRAWIAKGLVPPIEGGLPGAIEAAYALKAASDGETIKARLDKVMAELEQAWRREPCAANSLYGAALLAAVGDAYVTGALTPLLSKARSFIEEVTSIGHHGGVQRYLEAFFAQGPRLMGVEAMRGPAYSTEAVAPVVARLSRLPGDPWAILAHVHGLQVLLPDAHAKALSPQIDRAASLLLQGKEREAKELLLGLQPALEAGFVRPPVLEDRVATADKLWEAELLLRTNGVLERHPALDRYSETPTAENLAAARVEWAPIRARAMAKAAAAAENQRRAALEIAVNLVDAVLAPNLDLAWIDALEMLVGKARAAERREDRKDRVVPERALVWALQQMDGHEPQSARVFDARDARDAIHRELLNQAAGPLEQRLETLSLARQVLERWAGGLRATNPLQAQVITEALRDAGSAEAAGAPELGLHLLIGTLTDVGYTDRSYRAGERNGAAADAFASRYRALTTDQPQPGTDPREFAASLVGSLRILSACLPEAHPLRPTLDGAIDRGLRDLIAGRLEAAQGHLRDACRIGGSLSFDPGSRQTFGRGDAAGPTRVKVRDLQPGDVVHLDPPPGAAPSPIACFGGRVGDRDYFTAPSGDTWSMKIDPKLEVDRFSSLARLWEDLTRQPGAVGGWTYAPVKFKYRDTQEFGRLERGEDGTPQLRIADGTTQALALDKLKDLQVGLDKEAFWQRFLDQHLGEWVLIAHQGGQTMGVLLQADDRRLELRGATGERVILERALVESAQSAGS